MTRTPLHVPARLPLHSTPDAQPHSPPPPARPSAAPPPHPLPNAWSNPPCTPGLSSSMSPTHPRNLACACLSCAYDDVRWSSSCCQRCVVCASRGVCPALRRAPISPPLAGHHVRLAPGASPALPRPAQPRPRPPRRLEPGRLAAQHGPLPPRSLALAASRCPRRLAFSPPRPPRSARRARRRTHLVKLLLHLLQLVRVEIRERDLLLCHGVKSSGWSEGACSVDVNLSAQTRTRSRRGDKE